MRVMELHSPVKLIQRSKGRSATAAAAYRSGTLIECERTGDTHDYRKKEGVEFDAVLIPNEAPKNIIDRKSLWNAAELQEKRKNSQTARDIEISFPAEFSPEQRQEAGVEIGKFLFARYGVAVDMCWHEPSKQGDERNYHLHILMTTRRFEEGNWAKTKDRILDDRFGKGREEVTRLRQGIADSMNNIAARDNVPVYIEHLSFEKRGIDREPLKPMSKEAIQLERDGIKTDIGNLNREIKKRNAEREQLYEQKNAVNMEIKRAELKAKETEAHQIPSETPKIDPQMQEKDSFADFYQETQKRRRELLQAQETQFGEERQKSMKELAQIWQVQEKSNWFIGFWRMISGQAQRDEERSRELQSNLETIHQQQQESFENFEKDRQKRLEAMRAKELTQEVSRENDLEQSPEDRLKQKLLAKLERNKDKQELNRSQRRGFER